MKKILLTTFFLLAFKFISLPCSCDWAGNFLEIYNAQGLTVIGKVSGYNYYKGEEQVELRTNSKNEYDRMTVLVEVENVINGEENRKQIEILGSNGMDCLMPALFFKVGNQYLFYLSSFEHMFNLETGDKIFGLYVCAETSLKYYPETEEVEGMINGLERGEAIRMKLENLLLEMKKNNKNE